MANSNQDGEKMARETLLQLVDLEGFINKVRKGDVEEVRKALDRDPALAGLGGADLVDESGHRPLHYAAAEGKLGMVKLLIEKKASVSAPTDDEKKTPLHFAVKFQNLQACELLVRYGVDTKAKDAEGRDPLSYATSQPIFHAVKHGDTVNDYVNEVNGHLKKMYAYRRALVRRPVRDEARRVAIAYTEWWREVQTHNREHDDNIPLPPKLGQVSIGNIMKASVAKPPTVGLHIFAGDEHWSQPLSGLLRWSYTTFNDIPAVVVEDIYVNKKLRRCKIGAAMITHLFISVHRGPKRIRFVYTVLDHTMEWAIDFFAAVGFVAMQPIHVPKPMRKQGLVVMSVKHCELELHKIAKVLHDRRLDDDDDAEDDERERRAMEVEAARKHKEFLAWEKEYNKQFAEAEIPRMRPLVSAALPPPEVALSELAGVEGDPATKRRHAALEKKERDRAARPFICENDRVPAEVMGLYREEIQSNRQHAEWRAQMKLREPRHRSRLLNLTRNLRSAWMVELQRDHEELAMPEGWVLDQPANNGERRYLHTETRETRSKRPRLLYGEDGALLREEEPEAEETEGAQERREEAFSVEVVAEKKKKGDAARRAEVKAKREWLSEMEAIIAQAQNGKWSQELMDEHLASKFGDGTEKANQVSSKYRVVLQQAESINLNYKLAAQRTHARDNAPPAPAASATVAAGNFGSPPKARPATASSRPAASPPPPSSRLRRPPTASPAPAPPLPRPSSPSESSSASSGAGGRRGRVGVAEWVQSAQERETALAAADDLLDLCAPPPAPRRALIRPPSPPSPSPSPDAQAASAQPPLGEGEAERGVGNARQEARSEEAVAAAGAAERSAEEEEEEEEEERPGTAGTALSAATTTVEGERGAWAERKGGADGAGRRRRPGSSASLASQSSSSASLAWSRPGSESSTLSRHRSGLWPDLLAPSSRPPSRDPALGGILSRPPSRPSTSGSFDRWSRPSSSLSAAPPPDALVIPAALWSRPASGIPPEHAAAAASSSSSSACSHGLAAASETGLGPRPQSGSCSSPALPPTHARPFRPATAAAPASPARVHPAPLERESPRRRSGGCGAARHRPSTGTPLGRAPLAPLPGPKVPGSLGGCHDD